MLKFSREPRAGTGSFFISGTAREFTSPQYKYMGALQLLPHERSSTLIVEQTCID